MPPTKCAAGLGAWAPPGKANPVHPPRLRKPKHFHALRPGHCVALDSIELQEQGDRRYVITCTDLHSHFAWAWATRSHASTAAAQFFRLIQAGFPFAIETVLTDNGSEFQRHFTTTLAELLHTLAYLPQTPPHERPLRTLQPHRPGGMHRLPLRPALPR